MPFPGYKDRLKRHDVLTARKAQHMTGQARRIRVGRGLKLSQVNDGVLIELDFRPPIPVGNPGYGTGIEDVGSTASNGTDASVARTDHVHAGIPPLETVEELPDIPTTGLKFVFWTSVGDGDGDDQVWMASEDSTLWAPTEKSTTLSGAPPA